MTQSPEISVVMPCFNAALTIEKSIHSVREQTFEDFELVIVDDGSTDASYSLIQSISLEDPRVRVFHQQNKGAGPARNLGLEKSRGKAIAFLDSDDYWDSRFMQKLHAALDSSGADLAYCGWQNLGLTGGRGDPFIPPDYSAVDRVELFLGGNRWPIHGVLTRSAMIERVGGFDNSLTSCMDYDLWLRLSPLAEVVLVPEVLAFYQHHEGEQITKNRARVAINHCKAQRQFLANNTELATRLGTRKTRMLTYGELMRRGYVCYWDRNLEAARKIFREVMRGGYGDLKDWKYMLPSLLPLTLHKRLIQRFEKPALSE